MAYSGSNRITHLLQVFRQSRSRGERTTGAQKPRGGGRDGTGRGGDRAKPCGLGVRSRPRGDTSGGQGPRGAVTAPGEGAGFGHGGCGCPAAERPHSPDGASRVRAAPGEKKRDKRFFPGGKAFGNLFYFILFFNCPALFERGRGTSLPRPRIHIHESAGK